MAMKIARPGNVPSPGYLAPIGEIYRQFAPFSHKMAVRLYRIHVSSEHTPESDHSMSPAREKSADEQGALKTDKPASGAEQTAPAAELAPQKKRKDWSRPRSPLDEEARRIIRSEMERRDMSYAQLAALLEPRAKHLGIGRPTEHNLTSRINRGTFTFGFAIEVLRAIGATKVDLAPLTKPGSAGK
jgi:Domain of unknown function (DUF6471)